MSRYAKLALLTLVESPNSNDQQSIFHNSSYIDIALKQYFNSELSGARRTLCLNQLISLPCIIEPSISYELKCLKIEYDENYQKRNEYDERNPFLVDIKHTSLFVSETSRQIGFCCSWSPK